MVLLWKKLVHAPSTLLKIAFIIQVPTKCPSIEENDNKFTDNIQQKAVGFRFIWQTSSVEVHEITQVGK